MSPEEFTQRMLECLCGIEEALWMLTVTVAGLWATKLTEMWLAERRRGS